MKKLLFVVFALGALMVVGCGRRGYVVEGNSQLYTMVNLRAHRGTVSSVGYQNHRLLPVCTPVSVDSVRRNQIRFTITQTGERMRYVMHRASRTGIETHLNRTFGTGCPQVASMVPEDQSGVASGQVYTGMTRAGVLTALGYPPDHRTPDLGASHWTYWSGRMRTFEVHFDGDRVAGVAPM